jgi:erythromycin esterase-like protein
LFIWAHNGHIAVGLEAWPSMGTILREAYGTNYFAIGQTFDHGMVAQAQMPAVAISPAAHGTSEATFREAGLPIFFLDFHAVPQSTALGRWLAQPQLIRSLGGALITSADAQNEMKTVLSRAFDALIFVYEARAAQWNLGPPQG